MGLLDKKNALITGSRKGIGRGIALRFASEGHEGFYNRSLIEEVESEILSLARYLPVNYNIKSLIQSTKLESDSGSVLAQLYLERCYMLYEEDYTELKKTEDKIKWIEEHLNQFR